LSKKNGLFLIWKTEYFSLLLKHKKALCKERLTTQDKAS